MKKIWVERPDWSLWIAQKKWREEAAADLGLVDNLAILLYLMPVFLLLFTLSLVAFPFILTTWLLSWVHLDLD